jgi:hypothetical protein
VFCVYEQAVAAEEEEEEKEENADDLQEHKEEEVSGMVYITTFDLRYKLAIDSNV